MKRFILILLAALLSLWHPSAAAQALKTFPGDSLRETGRVFTAPLRLTTGGAELAVAMAAAGLLVYSQDGQIRRLASKNRSSSADGVFNTLEKFGNGGYEAAFLPAHGTEGRLAPAYKF